MNVSTMRRIDLLGGLPGCVLLSGLRKLRSWLPGRASDADHGARSVVFLKLAEQGSTVLAYPALRAAVERYGASNVYFLVFEQNRFVLDAMEIVPAENVIAIRTGSLVTTLVNVLRAVRRLRRLKIDAAVDLEFFARATAILSFLSGARQRVGLHAFAGDGPYRGDLMTHRVIYNPHVHTSQMFLLQVQALDRRPQEFPAFAQVPVPLSELPLGTFAPTRTEIASVEQKLRGLAGLEEAPRLVLLNANCGDLLPLRRWDENNFVALARRILDEAPDVRVALTGAPDEAPAVERLVERIASPRCFSLAGKTTLRELLVVYGLSQVLVTNDSGPAHFATLTGIDVICLFGPETPELFGSLSSRSHVLWAETACSPCVSAYNNRVSRCRDNVCMQRIEVDEVLAKVRDVLEARAAGLPTEGGAWLIPAAERRAAAGRPTLGRPRPEAVPLVQGSDTPSR